LPLPTVLKPINTFYEVTGGFTVYVADLSDVGVIKMSNRQHLMYFSFFLNENREIEYVWEFKITKRRQTEFQRDGNVNFHLATELVKNEKYGVPK